MKFTLPIRVPVGKKTFALNLNIYRNSHHTILSLAKVNYHLLVMEAVGRNRPKHKGAVSITYTLFVGTRRKCDISNVCCIVDKFACDSLQKLGIIEEDNYNHVPVINYRYGGYDKNNERVEVEINEI